MPQTRSMTALAKRCEPEPSYHPLYYLKFFPHDTVQQDAMFGNDFDFDFSKWPHEFWFKPKQVTTNFHDVISKLKLAIIIPPIILTSANGIKRGWFDIQIRVHYPNDRNVAFIFYACHMDFDNPHKIEGKLCSAIEHKLLKYTEFGTIHKICKISIHATTSF